MIKKFIVDNLFKVDGSLRNAYTSRDGYKIKEKWPDMYDEIIKYPGRTIIEKLYCIHLGNKYK